ncbi:MAG: RT0821/Lpp0805 family surface protein [Pseudomonadota bacterium]
MTRRFTKPLLAIPLALSLGLSACAANTGPKEGLGTLLGAGTGALAGSQIGKGRGQLVAVAVGTLAGAYLGSEIGKSLDRADRLYMAKTSGQALESNPIGQTSTWVNPDSGNTGTITPTRTYQANNNRYCREFQQTVTVGGNTEQAYGTACRQEDGSWEIVSPSAS